MAVKETRQTGYLRKTQYDGVTGYTKSFGVFEEKAKVQKKKERKNWEGGAGQPSFTWKNGYYNCTIVISNKPLNIT